MANEQVKSALLELGLEDWIPLPEAMSSPEVLAAAGVEDVEAAIREALVVLIRSGEIAIYRGPWNEESEPVDTSVALRLLDESMWYRFRIDDPHEERLYFVNVENIRR
ncbi:MAG: hypothetical protein ACLP01_25830 [Solirubrobacteraceae bacterium]